MKVNRIKLQLENYRSDVNCYSSKSVDCSTDTAFVCLRVYLIFLISFSIQFFNILNLSKQCINFGKLRMGHNSFSHTTDEYRLLDLNLFLPFYLKQTTFAHKLKLLLGERGKSERKTCWVGTFFFLLPELPSYSQ